MKLIKDEKGQALVEFAIILPIIMLIVMGIIEFGLMINSYLNIENASREGARTGIVGSTNTEIEDTIVSISPTLDSERISVIITPTEASRRSGDTLTIEVKYNYNITMPIISNLVGNTIELKAQTSMRIE